MTDLEKKAFMSGYYEGVKIKINSLDIKPENTVLITYTIGEYLDLDDASKMHELLVKEFPNNKVVATLKEVEITTE